MRRRRRATSGIAKTIGNAVARTPHAIGAIVQGAIYVPLTTACAAVLGGLDGFCLLPACGGTELGPFVAPATLAAFGATGGFLLGFFTLPVALTAPIGVDKFLGWFLTGPLLLEISLAVGVFVGFLTERLVPTSGLVSYFTGFVACQCAAVILAILFQDPLAPRNVEGEGLSSFEEIKRRARDGNLWGRVARGPAPHRRAATWRDAWKRWWKQQEKARGKFYGKVHFD